jgi:nucleotide-binding universal stress UspA family protein
MTILAPWIVGIDLGPHGHGALVFASWLRRTSGVPVIGMHVREVESRFTSGVDADSVVRGAIDERLSRLGFSPIDKIEVVAAGHAEEGLIAAMERAEGLVLGRAATTDPNGWIRLGRVTRRVLRAASAPVVVVPPDLAVVGDGPVLLATDLGPASSTAARWAAAFAEEHERPLEVVHVAAPTATPFDALAPQARPDGIGVDVAGAMDAWLSEHGLAERPRHALTGEPIEQVAATAAARMAVLVVTGSRRLATAERLFAASTSSALAGRCACPVAVVPPA